MAFVAQPSTKKSRTELLQPSKWVVGALYPPTQQAIGLLSKKRPIIRKISESRNGHAPGSAFIRLNIGNNMQYESNTNTRHGRPTKIDQLLIPVVQEVLNNAQERTEAELPPPPETTT